MVACSENGALEMATRLLRRRYDVVFASVATQLAMAMSLDLSVFAFGGDEAGDGDGFADVAICLHVLV